MSTQHTPGPWKVMGDLTNHPDVAAVNPEGVFCGSIAFINRKSPEWQANARLMAAAPDLLAALEKIANPEEESADCGCYTDSGWRVQQCGAHDPGSIAQAAIAKAGEGS